MNVLKISNKPGLSSKIISFSNSYGEASTKFACSLTNVIRKSLVSFTKKVDEKVPDVSIYGFQNMAHFLKGVEPLTTYSAMLELKLPLNNPDTKYNTIKRLTLSLYDKNKPDNVVTNLLVKGTKSDILKYLRDKDTPAKIKKLIDEDKYHLLEDIDMD